MTENQGSFPAEKEIILLATMSRATQESSHIHIKWALGVLSLGIKWLTRESAEVKKA
jgi:hypothetical protein